MFRHVLRASGTLCAAVVAPDAATGLVSSQNQGWERVKNIFIIDEFGRASPELVSMMQTTFFSAFVGSCYGGYLHSREAYLRFIERNDATKFRDHLEAKKKLQDFVTVNFAKGAFKFGWRIGLFGSFYVSFVTVFTVYRGEPSILDYVGAGFLAGGIYRLNYGIRGFIVGSTIGSMMGLFAGSLTTTLLRLTGTKYDDIYNWQNEQYESRYRHVAEAAHREYDRGVDTSLLAVHDSMLEKSKS